MHHILDVLNYYVIVQKDLYSSASPKITPIDLKKPILFKNGPSFSACTNLNVDWNIGQSLSAGGPPSAHLRLWGLPWTRHSRRSLAYPFQSTMFKNLDRTPFTYNLTIPF